MPVLMASPRRSGRTVPPQVFTMRTLRVRLARRHPEIGPDLRQVALLHAQQVDALRAGDLDHPGVVLFGDIGDLAQFGGRGDAAAMRAPRRTPSF
jgi:hypothetical protein